MKKIMLLFVLLGVILMTSCSDPREEVLTSYLENGWIDGTKVDLNMNIVELKDAGNMTANDSADYLIQKFKDYSGLNKVDLSTVEKIDTLINGLNVAIESSTTLLDLYLTRQSSYYSEISETKSNLRFWKEFNVMLSEIRVYREKGDAILGNLVDVKFSMLNPVFKMKQTFYRQYLYSVSGDKILGLIKTYDMVD